MRGNHQHLFFFPEECLIHRICFYFLLYFRKYKKERGVYIPSIYLKKIGVLGVVI